MAGRKGVEAKAEVAPEIGVGAGQAGGGKEDQRAAGDQRALETGREHRRDSMSATARDADMLAARDASGSARNSLLSRSCSPVLAVVACFAPAQSDTWWLLRAGADIWHTHAVPLKDTYSFTAAGAAWPNHEWLFEAVMYAAYKAGGMAAVSALCAAAIIAASSISWRLMRGSFEIKFVLFAACLATAAVGWALRPQVLTLLAFALTCKLVTESRERWLPALFLVWSNAHGGVVLGIVAIAAAVAGRWTPREGFRGASSSSGRCAGARPS